MRVKTAAIPLNRLPWSQRPTCPTLCAKPGEPQSADGARRETRHLQRSVCVFHGEHGSLREGCQGEWEGGKGDPNETPTPSRRVGWGRVVGARESRVHGDADPWRRPLACGKTGAKVPSERASCPRCIPCRLEKCEGTLHGALPWRRTAGAEPCEVKASSTVLNGGDEETGLFRPRLVATQLPRSHYSPRLMRSVRLHHLVNSKRNKGVDMSDDNKRNLMFFESPSVRELYDTMDEWQKTNRKRLHSVNIQKDGDMFCCIALTNPTEVIITDATGETAFVSNHA